MWRIKIPRTITQQNVNTTVTYIYTTDKYAHFRGRVGLCNVKNVQSSPQNMTIRQKYCTQYVYTRS
jgi:hypothetical protein